MSASSNTTPSPEARRLGVWRFTGGDDVAAVARPAAAGTGRAVRMDMTFSRVP